MKLILLVVTVVLVAVAAVFGRSPDPRATTDPIQDPAATLSELARHFEPPISAPPESPATITANEEFVYVLRGDEILQFDSDTLDFVRRVRLPWPAEPRGPGSRPAAR